MDSTKVPANWMKNKMTMPNARTIKPFFFIGQTPRERPFVVRLPKAHLAIALYDVGVRAGKRARMINPKTFKKRAKINPSQPG